MWECGCGRHRNVLLNRASPLATGRLRPLLGSLRSYVAWNCHCCCLLCWGRRARSRGTAHGLKTCWLCPGQSSQSRGQGGATAPGACTGPAPNMHEEAHISDLAPRFGEKLVSVISCAEKNWLLVSHKCVHTSVCVCMWQWGLFPFFIRHLLDG